VAERQAADRDRPGRAPGTLSYTLAAIETLLESEVKHLGQGFTLAAKTNASCRYCSPYHCDRVSRKIMSSGKDWLLYVQCGGVRYAAHAFLEFEYPATI